MSHPYPPHLKSFDYVGFYSYFLTFVTHERRREFKSAEAVDLVRSQFLRAGRERQIALEAYCFMEDHVHLLVRGRTESSECVPFVNAAKQFSGFYFSRRFGRRLWQRYGYDRALRSEFERAMAIRYILLNPVMAGLVERPGDYPFLGSEQYTIEELVEQAGGAVVRPDGTSREIPDLVRFFSNQAESSG